MYGGRGCEIESLGEREHGDRPRNYIGKIKLSALKAACCLRALFSDMRDARFVSTCI